MADTGYGMSESEAESIFSSVVGEVGTVEDSGSTDDDDFAWDPEDFGSASIEKVKTIASILKKLLEEITLNIKYDGGAYSGYTKEEVLRLLTEYVNRTEFSNLAGDLVVEKTNSYLTDLENQGQIVRRIDLSDIEKVLNWLTQICFNEDYEELKENGSISFTSHAILIDNLRNTVYGSGGAGGIERILTAVCSVIYKDPSIREGIRLATKDELSAVSDVVGTGDLDTDASTLIDAVNELKSDIEDVRHYSSVDEVRSDIESVKLDISVVKLSISGWDSRFEGLSSRVSDLESKVSSIQSDIESIKTRLDALDEGSES